MKNINGNFSLRETLQIVIPGIYLVALMTPIINKLSLFNLTDYSESILFILSSIFSLILGMIIYAFDLPKRLWFFKSNLPTTKISQNLSHIENAHNAYFEFYDNEISDKQKDITEKYTSIYHFSVNMVLASFILTAGYVVVFFNSFLSSYGILTLTILVLSIILTAQIFYGNKKINYMFMRQYDKFVKQLGV